MAFSPDEVEQLFEQPQEPQGGAVETPQPPQQTPAPAGPDPTVFALQQQVGQLTGTVQALTSMFQQNFQRPAEPPPQQKQEYFTEQDVDALLTHPNKAHTFNVLAQKIRDDAVVPMSQALQQANMRLNQFEQQQQQERQRVEANRQAEENKRLFTSSYPDLEGMDSLIATEAARLDAASRANPYMLAGKTNKDLMDVLATNVRAEAGRIAARMNGTPVAEGEKPRAPARSTYMERGGAARMPAPAQTKDPNKAALTDMANYLGRRQQR
jgi:hypothetical protein